MKNNTIWIVTELFYPEETAVAFIFTRIANYLSKKYKVCVICGPEFYDNHKKDFIDRIDISPDIEVFRIKSFPLDKNSILQRTIKTGHLSLSMGFLMLRKISKGEAVLLGTTPSFLLLFVRYLKVFRRFRLHILVHDVFPENALPARIFKNEKAITFRIFKFLYDRAYSSADHLIVIGRDMKEVIIGKINSSKRKPKISIVPNWTNPEKVKPDSRSASNHNIVLQYAGNVGRVQGIMEILIAFKASNCKNVILKIRGTGAYFHEVKKYIDNSELSNVFLEGGFSRNEEYEILKNCDIGIVSLSYGMYGLGVPSKTYHLLSAGKPILYIGEPDTEVACIVKEKEIGWAIDIRRQDDIIEFFNNINLMDRNTLKNMGERARSLAHDYSEDKILGLLQAEIESIELNIV